jgi:phosphate/sulfate permease
MGTTVGRGRRHQRDESSGDQVEVRLAYHGFWLMVVGAVSLVLGLVLLWRLG